MNYLVYSISTGEILRSGNVPLEAVQLQAGAGEGVLADVTASSLSYYVDTVTQKLVRKNPMVLSTDGNRLDGIPIPAMLYVKNYGVTVESASVDIKALYKLPPSTYIVKVVAPRYNTSYATIVIS